MDFSKPGGVPMKTALSETFLEGLIAQSVGFIGANAVSHYVIKQNKPGLHFVLSAGLTGAAMFIPKGQYSNYLKAAMIGGGMYYFIRFLRNALGLEDNLSGVAMPENVRKHLANIIPGFSGVGSLENQPDYFGQIDLDEAIRGLNDDAVYQQISASDELVMPSLNGGKNAHYSQYNGMPMQGAPLTGLDEMLN